MRHPSHIAVILRHIEKKHLDVAEICGLVERSQNHVYRCHDPNDNTDYRASELITLSRYLSEMGYNDLAECMISPLFAINPVGEGRCNGSVDDEISEFVEQLGRIKIEHGVRNKDGIKSCIQKNRGNCAPTTRGGRPVMNPFGKRKESSRSIKEKKERIRELLTSPLNQLNMFEEPSNDDDR